MSFADDEGYYDPEMELTMNKFCTKHNKDLKEYTSKNTGGKYFGHYVPNEGMCFGDENKKEKSPTFANSTSSVAKADAEQADQKVWDAKDRQSMAQTAMKSASEIVAALINAGIETSEINQAAINVKTMANDFYKELKKLKAEV